MVGIENRITLASTSDGLCFLTLSKDNVCYAEASLAKTFLKQYTCMTNVIASIPSNKLSTVLQSANGRCPLVLRYDVMHRDTIELEFTSGNHDEFKVRSTLKVRILSNDDRLIVTESVEKGEIKLYTSWLREALTAMELFGDKVTFSSVMKEDSFAVWTATEAGSICYTTACQTNLPVCSGTYALAWLQKLLTDESGMVTLQVRQDRRLAIVTHFDANNKLAVYLPPSK